MEKTEVKHEAELKAIYDMGLDSGAKEIYEFFDEAVSILERGGNFRDGTPFFVHLLFEADRHFCQDQLRTMVNRLCKLADRAELDFD